MRKKLTAFLLIVLTLIQPLRAMANMGMIACTPAQHPVVSAIPSHEPGMDMQGMPCCHGAEASATSQDHCHNDHGSKDKHSVGASSVCGECCVGVLIVPFIPQAVLRHEPASSLIAFRNLAYSGFLPDGLERPPRFFS